MLRIPDRPAARGFRERLDVLALLQGNHQLFRRWHVRLGVAQIQISEGRVADVRRTRLHQALDGLAARAGPVRFHARCRGAPGESQAVDLADYGVAGNATQAPGDLARAQAVSPEFLEKFYTLVVPGHALVLQTFDCGTRATQRTPGPCSHDRPGKSVRHALMSARNAAGRPTMNAT